MNGAGVQFNSQDIVYVHCQMEVCDVNNQVCEATC